MTISLFPNKNRSLARITTMVSPSWVFVKTPNLPSTLRSQLNLFFKNIAGMDLEEDLATLACQFDRDTKTYVKTFAPAIYKDVDNNVVVCWGNKLFPLTPKMLKFFDAEVRIEEMETYKEPCLILVLEDGEDYLELPLQLKIDKDHSEVPLSEIKKVIKNAKSGKGDLSGLAELLWTREIKEGSTGNFAPTLALKELETDVTYLIDGYEYKEFPTHHNYVLSLTNVSSGETVQAWAPALIKNALDFGAILVTEGGEGKQSGFKYFIQPGKKRDKYIVVPENIVWPEDEEEQVTF